jgi:hypothetical protein
VPDRAPPDLVILKNTENKEWGGVGRASVGAAKLDRR